MFSQACMQRTVRILLECILVLDLRLIEDPITLKKFHLLLEMYRQSVHSVLQFLTLDSFKLIKTTSIWGLVFGVLVMATLRFNSCITYGLPAGIPIHCYSYKKGEMVDVMLNLTETVQHFTPND